jgi:uncharacterized membrane protein required for colicin V production
MLTALIGLVFLAAAGLLWLQGAWSNLITFFNLIFAALVASSFFEPLSTLLEDNRMTRWRFLTEFLFIWLLFSLTFLVMRLVTDIISKERVEFLPAVEHSVCGVMSVVNAWVLVCFITMTLHLAPLGSTPFKGAFSSPQEASFLGLSPDGMWLGFVRHQSKTIMSGREEFNAGGDFRDLQARRRAEFEKTADYLD